MNDSGLVPVGYFVVVALDENDGKIGSIYVPPSVQEKDDLSTQEGTLVAVGPHAFNWAEEWPEGTKPQVGQRVLFKRYAGHLHERGGRKWRLLHDKEHLIAIVEPKANVLSAAA
jgi:co-chaperonin GroES (HSP10)